MAIRFDIGDVIGRTFSVWARHAVPFGLVAIALSIPQVAAGYPVALEAEAIEQQSQFGNQMPDIFGFLGRSLKWYAVVLVCTIIAQAFIAGTIAHATLASLQGRRESIGASFVACLRRIWPVLVITLMFQLALACLFVPYLVLCLFFFPAIPAVMAERSGTGRALSRAMSLSEGCRGRCLLIVVVFLLILFAATAVVAVVNVFSSPLTAQTLGLLPASFAVPLQAVAAAVTYHYLVEAKEGGTAEALAAVFE